MTSPLSSALREPRERGSSASARPDWLPVVRAVLFDLDNTLYDHSHASRMALSAAALEFEGTAGVACESLYDEFTRHNDACWALAVRGEMTREELALARFERTLASLGIEGLQPTELAAAYLARYRRFPAEVPGAREATLRLLESVPVGIVTNGFPDYVEDKLAAIGLAGRLHPVVVAERIEVMKPRSHGFLAAIDALGLAPETVLYVGDSPAVDVAGAAAAGLRSCWFDRLGSPWPEEVAPPDLTIRNLAELPELLTESRAGMPPRAGSSIGGRSA